MAASPSYQSPEEFVAGGMQTQCPITLVDAGPLSDQIITQLADRKDITTIVTGVGPVAGSDDPSSQVIYRLGTTLPGWLTSASTRREGIVTLTDLTRTLIDFGAPGSVVAVDGSPFAVYGADLTLDAIEAKIDSVAALSDAALIGYLALGLGGAVLFVIMVVEALRGRFFLPKLIMTFGGVLAGRDDAHRRRALAEQRFAWPGRQSRRGCLVGDFDGVGALLGPARPGPEHHCRDGADRYRFHL